MNNLYNVHKDFAQYNEENLVWGHEEYLGLEENNAKAIYHQLLAYAYNGTDPYINIFIMRTDGIHVFGEVIDRTPELELEPISESEPEELEVN